MINSELIQTIEKYSTSAKFNSVKAILNNDTKTNFYYTGAVAAFDKILEILKESENN